MEEGDGLCRSWLGTSLIQGAVREQSTPGDGRGLTQACEVSEEGDVGAIRKDCLEGGLEGRRS